MWNAVTLILKTSLHIEHNVLLKVCESEMEEKVSSWRFYVVSYSETILIGNISVSIWKYRLCYYKRYHLCARYCAGGFIPLILHSLHSSGEMVGFAIPNRD